VVRKLLVVAVFLIAALGLFYILFPQIKSQDSSAYQNISVQEFENNLKNNPFVVDVHTPEQEHIPGTDLFLDYTKVSENLDKFPKDKNTEILVYCRSGSMSVKAAQELTNAGYTNVKNLIGGKNAYDEVHQGINLTPNTIDLGIVIYGDVARTAFTLTNNTKKDVNIQRVTTSCSCTSAVIEKNTLTPGESTEVSVSFDPAVHKDDTDLGDITRTIFIETDHVNFSKVESTITANVIKK